MSYEKPVVKEETDEKLVAMMIAMMIAWFFLKKDAMRPIYILKIKKKWFCNGSEKISNN